MLHAPRILKAPIGWRFSHFSEKRSSVRPTPEATVDGDAATSTSMSGVRCAMPRMRSAAASMSSSVTSAARQFVAVLPRARELLVLVVTRASPGALAMRHPSSARNLMSFTAPV